MVGRIDLDTENEATISIDNVTKVYRSVSISGVRPILRRVNALVSISGIFREGILGLVGPNGAGKSTMIQIMAGVLRPTTGSITIFGLDSWKSTREVKKRVSFLSEDPEFPPLSGIRFLRYVGELRGLEKQLAERRAAEFLELLNLSDSANRSIRSYSAGMKRRIGIATAFVGDPEFIVLDEPTKALDPQGRDLLMKLITETHKEKGTNFLISSHILSDLDPAQWKLCCKRYNC